MVYKEKVVYRKFRRKDLADLMTPDFPFRTAAFNPTFYHRFLHIAKLIPHETKLVAYHVEKKYAIGFLQLTEHKESIYSINCVFTNSNFRRMGVATELLKYALSLVKSKNGKKCFLTAVYPNSDRAKLYGKLGFKPIVNTSIVYSAGFLTSLPSDNRYQLISLDTSSTRDRDMLFGIYKRCMGEKWVNFFETNKDNLINSFSQDFRHFCLKTALVDESESAFVLVFYYPPLSTATVRVYTTSNEVIPSIIEELYRILQSRGIGYTKITLFNIKEDTIKNKDLKFINKMDFALYLTFMGISL